MKKHFRTLLAFSALGIPSAALPAFCSGFDALHVTVPFAFMAGRTTLPAGDYIVTETSEHALLIRGSHASAILLESAGSEEASDRNSLGFQRTEKGIYLKSVRAMGRPMNVLHVPGETEK